MTEPTKGERTKQKLVDATAALLRKQGYHATGLSAIVDESGAPRGSLYFYFPGGKDELAVTALEQSGLEWRTRIEAAIAGVSDLGAVIDAIVKLLADDLVASKWENGCPVATVALEHTSPAVQAAVERHYEQWLDDIAERSVTFGVPKPLAQQFAVVAMSAVEGALLLCKVQRSTAPLYAVGAALTMLTALKPPERAAPGRRRSPRE
jgi:TetR/AcrR family transcriptional repressor of lmrAB and yxaGH operons